MGFVHPARQGKGSLDCQTVKKHRQGAFRVALASKWAETAHKEWRYAKVDLPTAEFCPQKETRKCSETLRRRQEVKAFSLNGAAYLWNECLSCPSGKWGLPSQEAGQLNRKNLISNHNQAVNLCPQTSFCSPLPLFPLCPFLNPHSLPCYSLRSLFCLSVRSFSVIQAARFSHFFLGFFSPWLHFSIFLLHRRPICK